MTYPSDDLNAYAEWTPPEHDCNFIVDTTVKTGMLDPVDKKMYIWELKRCNQCENTTAVKTNQVEISPT